LALKVLFLTMKNQLNGNRYFDARRLLLYAILGSLCGLPSAGAAQSSRKQTPKGFFRVKPLGSAPSGPSLRLANTQFFSYALPQGWRVGENGQFALTLVAPDNKAITVMVGNAGLPVNYPPGQFVYEKLSAMRPQNLQVGPARQAAPIAGFARAYQFDVSYSAQGIPSRGTVKCHVAPAYDTAVMAMTAALSAASQWQGYAGWLPLVADQVSATNGAAFGMRGIMAQNLRNSMAYAEAARKYREWSQKNWQQVTDQRNASEDRKRFYERENLGGVQTYDNPFGGAPVELPLTYKYYWIDSQGEILGTDDPSATPDTGSSEWRRMPRHKR
jgi:hypothetical protein